MGKHAVLLFDGDNAGRQAANYPSERRGSMSSTCCNMRPGKTRANPLPGLAESNYHQFHWALPLFAIYLCLGQQAFGCKDHTKSEIDLIIGMGRETVATG